MLNNKYDYNICKFYKDLLASGKNKDELTNYDLAKIFEFYSCIKLQELYDQIFYMYDEIDLTFKENNKMSHSDSGIDACNLVDTIVQCKLRKNSLTWKECTGTAVAV
jgi:hypothetical protein